VQNDVYQDLFVSFLKLLEILALVRGSLALFTISFSSFFAFGDFAAFSILFINPPIAAILSLSIRVSNPVSEIVIAERGRRIIQAG
jgi:hypothetical protein